MARHKLPLSIILAAVWLAVRPTPAEAQHEADWLRLEPVGQIGGIVSAVEVDGSHVYLGVGPRVVVLDVSDPTRPVQVGESAVLPNVVQDIALADGYAYVVLAESPPGTPLSFPPPLTVGRRAPDGDRSGGRLQVLDLSDPMRPEPAGAADIGPEARRIIVQDRLAYVGSGRLGLKVVDVSDPHAPRVIGETGSRVTANDLAADGRQVYVAQGDTSLADLCAGLIIGSESGSLVRVDASEASDPRLAGTVLQFADRVAADGDRLYAVGAGLSVLDITDAAAPRSRGHVPLPEYTTRVLAYRDRLYVAGDLGTALSVVDVSDPDAPRLLGETWTGPESWDLAVAGDIVYVASRREGLKIVSVAEPTAPKVVSRFRPPGVLRRIASVGDSIVGLDSCGVAVIGAADPTRPTMVAYYDAPPSGVRQPTADLAGGERGAFVAPGPDGTGLLWVDLEDPSAPGFVPVLAEVADAHSIALAHGLAYLSAADAGGGEARASFAVADVSTPARSRLLGRAPMPYGLVSLTAGGAFVFGLAGTNANGRNVQLVASLDVSDRALPRPIGSWELPAAYATDLALAGGYLLIARDGLWVADVADPARPRIVATVPSGANHIRVRDDRAFTVGPESVDVYSLADPAQPRLIGTQGVRTDLDDVDASGDRVYVAAGEAGLVILRQVDVPGAHAYLPVAWSGPGR